MKILVASSNQGKLKEFRKILEPLGYVVQSAEEAGYSLDHVVEDGLTFEDNALIKARVLYDLTGVPVVADDSGLSINALPDILGVYSARYMGYETPYDVRNKHILELLEDRNKEAYFTSVIAYVDGSNEYTFKGTIDGVIKEISGEGGFGYDPIFYPLGHEISFAQMSDDLKNEISHRAIALAKFIEHIKGQDK